MAFLNKYHVLPEKKLLWKPQSYSQSTEIMALIHPQNIVSFFSYLVGSRWREQTSSITIFWNFGVEFPLFISKTKRGCFYLPLNYYEERICFEKSFLGFNSLAVIDFLWRRIWRLPQFSTVNKLRVPVLFSSCSVFWNIYYNCLTSLYRYNEILEHVSTTCDAYSTIII